jgi:hypothetical protein
MRDGKNATAGRRSNRQQLLYAARAAKALHLVAAGSALLLVPKIHSARAATITWTGLGGDSNWNTIQNWSGTVGLPNGNTAQFAGSTQLSNNNNIASSTYNSIAFASGAGAFILAGNSVTLNASSALTVANNSTSTEAINLPLNVIGSRSIDAVAGPIVLGGGLNNSATGSPAGMFFGAVPSSLATAQTSSSVVILNSAATYTTTSAGTADTTVESGSLQVGAGGSLPTGSGANATGWVALGSAGNATVSIPATAGTLVLGDTSTPVNVTINRLVVTSSAAAGSAVVGGNSAISTLTINYNVATTGSESYSGILGGTGPNQNNLALMINGVSSTSVNNTVALSGTNTYVGDTTIGSGVLTLASTGSIAKSPIIDVGLTPGSAAGFNVSAVSGGFALASGQTLEGSGTVIGGVNVASGSTLSPGNSPGTLTDSGALTLSGGGNYLWQSNKADGTAGVDPGWDLESITAGLNITATPASKFNIQVASLTTGDTAGPASDFDPSQSYTWVIASAAGGITGFDPTAFNLDTSNFANSFSGTFGITTSGNNLELTYIGAPVPEPTTIAGALAIGAVGLLARRRRHV